MDKFEADYDYVTNDGPLVFFHTDKNAPLYQLVRINLEEPEEVSSCIVIIFFIFIIIFFKEKKVTSSQVFK